MIFCQILIIIMSLIKFTSVSDSFSYPVVGTSFLDNHVSGRRGRDATMTPGCTIEIFNDHAKFNFIHRVFRLNSRM